MTPPSKLLLALTGFFSLIQHATLAPSIGDSMAHLMARAVTKFENYDVEQEGKARQAFADAQSLARTTLDRTLEDGTTFQNSQAYALPCPFLV